MYCRPETCTARRSALQLRFPGRCVAERGADAKTCRSGLPAGSNLCLSMDPQTRASLQTRRTATAVSGTVSGDWLTAYSGICGERHMAAPLAPHPTPSADNLPLNTNVMRIPHVRALIPD